ncbi:MAG TPA: class I SAM-dependent methyltransferase [Bacteriovoracaceae bacterium]|nr:class I SAM-dependent methyltransferase [Bacteriovoracaceae bacterium]
MNCILCQSTGTHKWHEDKIRPYFKCETCSLIFVPRNFVLSAEKEKQRYDAHQNNNDDNNYREYLTKITLGILPYLEKGSRGLDFGCGSSTTLAALFEDHGFSVDSYDLYYFQKEELLQNKYDFIILSEVIEHLADPLETMQRLKSLLTADGQFFIKTKYYPAEKELFSNWFYKRDVTHVQFFSQKAMSRLAGILKMNEPEKIESEDLYRLKKELK